MKSILRSTIAMAAMMSGMQGGAILERYQKREEERNDPGFVPRSRGGGLKKRKPKRRLPAEGHCYTPAECHERLRKRMIRTKVPKAEIDARIAIERMTNWQRHQWVKAGRKMGKAAAFAELPYIPSLGRYGPNSVIGKRVAKCGLQDRIHA